VVAPSRFTARPSQLQHGEHSAAHRHKRRTALIASREKELSERDAKRVRSCGLLSEIVLLRAWRRSFAAVGVLDVFGVALPWLVRATPSVSKHVTDHRPPSTAQGPHGITGALSDGSSGVAAHLMKDLPKRQSMDRQYFAANLFRSVRNCAVCFA
jgi:hypothetical protein